MIAAWHLRDFNVGIGRYCRSLIEALARVDRSNEYEILMSEGCPPSIQAPNFRLRRVRFPFFRRPFWEQASSCFIGPYDIIHFPYDSRLRFKRGKFIATIHDVKPLVFPEWFPKSAKLHRGIERIDRVFTDSQSSKKDIIRLLGIPDEKIDVIYLGISEAFRRPPAAIGESSSYDIGKDYILYVGGGDRTKNLEILIEAFGQLPDRIRSGHQLVLVGDLKRIPMVRRAVEVRGLQSQVNFTGPVTDEDLIKIYHGASLFVYPSLYEGFGLPVLEAMASGVPVIASEASSLPEVVGDSGILVDPTSVKMLADAMQSVLTDKVLSDQLRRAGVTRAREFSWENTALSVLDGYRRAMTERIK